MNFMMMRTSHTRPTMKKNLLFCALCQTYSYSPTTTRRIPTASIRNARSDTRTPYYSHFGGQ